MHPDIPPVPLLPPPEAISFARTVPSQAGDLTFGGRAGRLLSGPAEKTLPGSGVSSLAAHVCAKAWPRALPVHLLQLHSGPVGHTWPGSPHLRPCSLLSVSCGEETRCEQSSLSSYTCA